MRCGEGKRGRRKNENVKPFEPLHIYLSYVYFLCYFSLFKEFRKIAAAKKGEPTNIHVIDKIVMDLGYER